MGGNPESHERATRGRRRFLLPVAIAILVALVPVAVTGRLPIILLAVAVVGAVVVFVAMRPRPSQVAHATSVGQPPHAGRKELRRSFPVRLAFWGFLLVPVSAAVGVAAGNVTSVFAASPFIVFAVVAALVLRITGRGLIPSLVVATLLLLASIDFGLLHLGHPQSFSDFVPTVLRVCGFALAVAGTTSALRGRRSGVQHTATRIQRRALLTGGALLVAVAVVSGILTATQQTTVVAANGAVVVTLEGDAFVPDTIRIAPGEPARVLVRNRDSYAHTFTVDALNVDQYIGPHSERLVTFTFPATAHKPLELYCAVIGHEDMTGKIVPKT